MQAYAIVMILVTWAIAGPILIGLGLLLRRTWGCKTVRALDCLTAFWVGFCLVMLILQILHLLLPVDWRSTFILSALGIMGLVWNIRPLWRGFIQTLKRRWLTAIVLLAGATWLADFASAQCATYDSGLYHLSAVRWVYTYPIVPGLGNLHDRLAFNNSAFLYDAAFNVGTWRERPYHVANGLLMTAIFWQVVRGAFRLLRRHNEQRAADLFDFMLLVPVLFITNGPMKLCISSYTPDVTTSALACATFSLLLRFVLYSRSDITLVPEPDTKARPSKTKKTPALDVTTGTVDLSPTEFAKEQAYALTAILLMATGAICIKLTLAAFSFVTAAVLGLCFILHMRRQRLPYGRPLVIAAGLAMMLLVPWAARGVITSGYPAFPSTFGGLPVPWKIPPAELKNLQFWIGLYGRQEAPGPPLEGWTWLGPWWNHNLRYYMTMPLGTILVGSVLLLATCIRPMRRLRWNQWLLWAPLFAGLAFWFFTAPAFRFGMYAFFILMALPPALACHMFVPPERPRRLGVALAMAGNLLLAGYFIWTMTPANIPIGIDQTAGRLIVRGATYYIPPGPNKGFYPPCSQFFPMTTRTTNSRLSIYLPVFADLCWDAPLPCAPPDKFRPELKLRRPNDLGSGFIVDPK